MRRKYPQMKVELTLTAFALVALSELFTMMHPPNALDSLSPEMLLGPIDPTTLPAKEEKVLTEDERRRLAAREEMPVAQNFLLLQDFEQWAERVLSNTAWAYYRSASDEERSKNFVPTPHPSQASGDCFHIYTIKLFMRIERLSAATSFAPGCCAT
jgi:hypothetical protein